MNYVNNIGDEEFIPFLHTLGVETYKKSFEWMLNDPDFSGVLQWIYSNIDHNNALTTREECRYAELEKKGRLLSPENLEIQIPSIQEEFKGLALAGDLESLEDVKLDINHQKEKLAMLQIHEKILKEMIAQKESTKENLTLDLGRLEKVKKQCTQEVKSASEHCTQLAEEVENITNSLVNVIADMLEVYGSCMSDKELSNQFFSFGPLEGYRQSQALFKSHFDLYTNKKFNSRDTDVSDADFSSALVEAKNMEECLRDTVLAYVESKAELSGVQAKMVLVSNYTNVHPSEITVCSMEAQSAVELLEQEESILEQQLQDAVRQYTHRRTRLAVHTTVSSALVTREQILKDLSFLLEVTRRAVSVDRVLYYALRRELRAAEELVHFAAHLRLYIIQEGDAVCSRMKSMSDICREQESVEKNLQSSNILVKSLSSIFGVNKADVLVHIKKYNELINKVPEFKEIINDGYKRKEEALREFKTSIKSLTTYIYDGCTRQPNCYNTAVSAMRHRLIQQREAAENRVIDTGVLFNDIKKNDKHSLRKLWQWFLTDQNKLIGAVKSVRH